MSVIWQLYFLLPFLFGPCFPLSGLLAPDVPLLGFFALALPGINPPPFEKIINILLSQSLFVKQNFRPMVSAPGNQICRNNFCEPGQRSGRRLVKLFCIHRRRRPRRKVTNLRWSYSPLSRFAGSVLIACIFRGSLVLLCGAGYDHYAASPCRSLPADQVQFSSQKCVLNP